MGQLGHEWEPTQDADVAVGSFVHYTEIRLILKPTETPEAAIWDEIGAFRKS